jgi:fumarate hydratase class I
VALELLKNANVAAGMVLPGCQDTGAACSTRTLHPSPP